MILRAAPQWLVQPLGQPSACQLYRALDAIYTAHNRPVTSTGNLLLEALRPSTSRYDRMGALAQIVEANAPGIMRGVQRSLQRAGRLPFRVDGVTPLAFGKGSSCVVLEGPCPLVLKVLRRSLGQSAATLATLARDLRQDYLTLQKWYGTVPGLLPETTHVVLHSPLRGVGAAARIQQLVRGPTRDLLGDFTDEQLTTLMTASPFFGERLRSFAAATRRAWDDEGRFLDMIGRNNVMVVERPSGPDLCVVDFGIMDMQAKLRSAPPIYARATTIVERLERLAALR